MSYLKSLGRHLGDAFVDVALISFITLMPLLLARLEPFANPSATDPDPFWAFLTNGQLAFYSIGSLAAILLAAFRQSLPQSFALLVGFGSVATLLFLAWLIGIDPELKDAPATFVGITTLYIYVAVQLLSVVTEALKRISAGDALRAGERASGRTRKGLAERMGVQNDR